MVELHWEGSVFAACAEGLFLKNGTKNINVIQPCLFIMYTFFVVVYVFRYGSQYGRHHLAIIPSLSNNNHFADGIYLYF